MTFDPTKEVHGEPPIKSLTLPERESRLDQKGTILWFTGLSGAGKSTLSNLLEKRLFDDKFQVYVLDGDRVRQGLCEDLGFSELDRGENIRRIGEVAKLFADAAFLVIVAFISPFRKDRDRIRQTMDKDRFIEVFVDCPLNVCVDRDTKGLYKKAIAHEIEEFTGISSPYEAPLTPEIHLHTSDQTIDECINIMVDYLKSVKAIR